MARRTLKPLELNIVELEVSVRGVIHRRDEGELNCSPRGSHICIRASQSVRIDT